MELSHIHSNRLREFTTTLFESVGGVVESVEDDLVFVLLPKELEGRFRPDLEIAFDPEVAQESSRRELLNYGTPLLDELVAFAEEFGTVSRVYPTGMNMTTSNLERHLKHSVRFEGCAMSLSRTKVKLFKYMLFTFKVRYTTDEREEEFIPIGINLYNGQIARRLLGALSESTQYAEENYFICPEAKSIDVYQAYRIAREEVGRKMTSALNLRRSAVDELIRQESSRIRKFYQDNDTELLERIQKEKDRQNQHADWTPGDRAKSEGRITALQSKRQVNEIERQRRLQEISDKHTLRTSVRLMNLLQIAYPKMVNTVTVTEDNPKKSMKDLLSVTAEVIWDPFTQSVEPPTCSKCGKTTTTLRWTHPPKSDPHLVCPEC